VKNEKQNKKYAVLTPLGNSQAAFPWSRREAFQRRAVVGIFSFDHGSKHNCKQIPFTALHCQRLCIPGPAIRLGFADELFKSDLLQSGGTIANERYLVSRSVRRNLHPRIE